VSSHAEHHRRRHAARRRADVLVADEIMAAVCDVAGLDPRAVRARPKVAAHAMARRAVVVGLRSLGWTNRRAMHAVGVTHWARRTPPLDLVTVATRAAGPIGMRTKQTLRDLAHRIFLAGKIERSALIAQSDEMGFDVADLARAIGVTSNTISRWRDPMWQAKRMSRARGSHVERQAASVAAC
jgi:hypothetical protein